MKKRPEIGYFLGTHYPIGDRIICIKPDWGWEYYVKAKMKWI